MDSVEYKIILEKIKQNDELLRLYIENKIDVSLLGAALDPDKHSVIYLLKQCLYSYYDNEPYYWFKNGFSS